MVREAVRKAKLPVPKYAKVPETRNQKPETQFFLQQLRIAIGVEVDPGVFFACLFFTCECGGSARLKRGLRRRRGFDR
jgi:hypothetical protein